MIIVIVQSSSTALAFLGGGRGAGWAIIGWATPALLVGRLLSTVCLTWTTAAAALAWAMLARVGSEV